MTKYLKGYPALPTFAAVAEGRAPLSPPGAPSSLLHVTPNVPNLNLYDAGVSDPSPGILRPPLLRRLTPQAESNESETTDNGNPAKKPKLAMDIQEDAAMSAMTSEYSLTEVLPDDDKTPFTKVTYRKNRPAGIPVIFKPTVAGSSFWRVNPNKIAQEIVATAQEKVQSQRINNDGSLSVTVASLQSANKLLEMSNVAGINVTTCVPQSYSRNMGKIKDVPLQYTDAELLEYLRDAGVISVRRQVGYTPQPNGNIQASLRSSVILQFRDDVPMPQRVLLGFTSHPVEEHFGPTIRCFRCQRHGHIAVNCRGPKRCKLCAGPHDFKECTSRDEPKCANCDGPHAASFSGCPRRRVASAIRKHEILHGRIPYRRQPPPNPDTVRLTSVIPAQHETNTEVHRKSYAAVAGMTPQRNDNSMTTGVPLQRSDGSVVSAPALKVPRESSLVTKDSRSLAPVQDAAAASGVAVASPPRASKGVGASVASQSVSVEHLLIPMFFAALKAIVLALPNANSLPEVQAFLAMEPAFMSNCKSLSSSG